MFTLTCKSNHFVEKEAKNDLKMLKNENLK